MGRPAILIYMAGRLQRAALIQQRQQRRVALDALAHLKAATRGGGSS